MYLSDVLLILLDPLVDQNLKAYIFFLLEPDSIASIHFFLELLLELLDIISMIFNISLKASELPESQGSPRISDDHTLEMSTTPWTRV